MTEEWIRWEPIPGLANKYYIVEIFDYIENLIIDLSADYDENNKLRIIFENSIIAYKSTDESFRDATMLQLKQKYGGEFYWNWTFFKVQNSEYLQWLAKESSSDFDNHKHIHLSLMGINSIVDIVTIYKPKVEIINNS